MANLINTVDGNVFYNYITPLLKGESGVGTSNLASFFNTAYGASNHAISGTNRYLRFPASGLETKTGTVTTSATTWRVRFEDAGQSNIGIFNYLSCGNSSSNSTVTTQLGAGAGYNSASSDVVFRVANEYSFCQAVFTSSTLATCAMFVYIGWLKEPSYSGLSTYPRGLTNFVFAPGSSVTNCRITTENNSAVTLISTANNSITNPSITCSISTPGADVTDIVIRDNASPNNAIGKMYNCLSLPNSCNVGEIWKNTGVDPETGGATDNNANKYLVVCPWGGRKLGMRIYTENVA
jgi:hypothetical protein